MTAVGTPASVPGPRASAEEDPGGAAFEPKIVGFLCNWCSYAGADKAGAAQIPYPPNVRVVRVMCSGRVDPQFVLASFAEGADGVLVLACHPGDCHYKEQNLRAVARHQLMSRLLTARGIDPRRFRFGFVSAAEAQEFADTVADMTEQLRPLGPLHGLRNGSPDDLPNDPQNDRTGDFAPDRDDLPTTTDETVMTP